MTRRPHSVPGQSLFERCFVRCADPRWDRQMTLMDRFGFSSDNGLGGLAKWLRFVYLTLPAEEEVDEEETAIQVVRRVGRRARVARPARSTKIASKLLELVASEPLHDLDVQDDAVEVPFAVAQRRQVQPALAVSRRRQGPQTLTTQSVRRRILSRAEAQWTQRRVPSEQLAMSRPAARVDTPVGRQPRRTAAHMQWSQSSLVFVQPEVSSGNEYDSENARPSTRRVFAASKRRVMEPEPFSLGSSRAIRPQESTRRPLARALSQTGKTQSSEAYSVLQDAVSVSYGAQRQTLQRLMAQTQTMDEVRQDQTIRRQLHRMQSPLLRSVRRAVESTRAPVEASRAVRRAASRNLPYASRERSFRPVMASMPSFVTLASEDVAPEVAPIRQLAGGNVAPRRTSAHQLRPSGAYPEPVQSDSYRSARTQQTTGRAGPDLVAASAAPESAWESPVQRIAQTAWAAKVGLGSDQNAKKPGLRKGLAALRMQPLVSMETTPVEHIVRRAEVSRDFGFSRMRPASRMTEAAPSPLIRRLTTEPTSFRSNEPTKPLVRAGKRFEPIRVSRLAFTSIPTSYVEPDVQTVDDIGPAAPRVRNWSQPPQRLSPALRRTERMSSGSPSVVRTLRVASPEVLATKNQTTKRAPLTSRGFERTASRPMTREVVRGFVHVDVPDLISDSDRRPARASGVSGAPSQRRGVESLALGRRAVETLSRDEIFERVAELGQHSDTMVSTPTTRLWNRGQLPAESHRISSNPMSFVEQLGRVGVENEPSLLQRSMFERLQRLAPEDDPTSDRYAGPSIRAAQRGRTAGHLASANGLWRMDVPMQHIQQDVGVSDEGAEFSRPMNRAAMRSIPVADHDSRGVRRVNPNPIGHVRSLERVKRNDLSGPQMAERPLRTRLSAEQGRIYDRVGDSATARVTQRSSSGSVVSNRMRGGLRSVPTSYLQVNPEVASTAGVSSRGSTRAGSQPGFRSVRVPFYDIPALPSVSHAAKRMNASPALDSRGQGRLVRSPIPAISTDGPTLLTNNPISRLNAEVRGEEIGIVRAGRLVRRMRGSEPRIEVLAFTEPQTSDSPNPAERLYRRRTGVERFERNERRNIEPTRSGSAAYASARLVYGLTTEAGPTKRPSRTSAGTERRTGTTRRGKMPSRVGEVNLARVPGSSPTDTRAHPMRDLGPVGTTRLERRQVRRRGLMPSPTAHVAASNDMSLLETESFAGVGHRSTHWEDDTENTNSVEGSHLNWVSSVGHRGVNRQSQSTYIGTMRMAFGAGLTRGDMDEIPSWAERAAHGDLSTMRVARRQKTMQIESIQQLVNTQSVEQMMGVLAQHRRSLEQVAEFLPSKAAKVLDQLVNLDSSAMRARAATESTIAADAQGQGTGRKTIQQTTLSGPRRSNRTQDSANGRASHLANQLLKLIHLAEVDRRIEDAHKEVRMSQHEPGGGSTTGSDAGGQGEQAVPNIKELFADVLEYVTREMERDKLRNMGNF